MALQKMRARQLQEVIERQEKLDAEQITRLTGESSAENHKDIFEKFKVASKNKDLDEN